MLTFIFVVAELLYTKFNVDWRCHSGNHFGQIQMKIADAMMHARDYVYLEMDVNGKLVKCIDGEL